MDEVTLGAVGFYLLTDNDPPTSTAGSKEKATRREATPRRY